MLFVSCAPTLEPLLIEELKLIGINPQDLKEGYRGVFVSHWNEKTLYLINYASRLACRVWLPIANFRCTGERSLYEGAMAVDWSAYLNTRTTFAIDANVTHKRFQNSLFAAQVVKDAICDQFRKRVGARPSVDVKKPQVQLGLFIHGESAVLSFDTSGSPLNQRGYRQESVEAPMQETLAAAILIMAKYSKEKILFDPCCGSGTLLIEAALIASNTAPGYLRRQWGFMRLPSYDEIEWLRVKGEIDQKRIPLSPGHIFGIDRAVSAVRAAKINVRAAGFQKEIEINQADFREYSPLCTPDLIVTNPPHGNRLCEDPQLAHLYRSLGDFMKHKGAKSGQGFIFTTNMDLAKEVGLATKKKHILSQSGVEARLLEYDFF